MIGVSGSTLSRLCLTGREGMERAPGAHLVSWNPLKLPVATNRLSKAGQAIARHRRYASAWRVMSGLAPILCRKKGAPWKIPTPARVPKMRATQRPCAVVLDACKVFRVTK